MLLIILVLIFIRLLKLKGAFANGLTASPLSVASYFSIPIHSYSMKIHTPSNQTKMIKSSTTTQELRLQRPGQSPTTMDSLKTSFLPNLSMDTGDGVVNALYCPMCGQHYSRQQLLAEHMQICHHGSAGIMMQSPILSEPPPPDSLKIEHPCLSCDDKFPSAEDLDEHNRIAHQAFLARCLSCGIYGISSTSLQEGSSGGEYKCMHCGAVCTADALAGQQAYLEQQTTYIDQPTHHEEETQEADEEDLPPEVQHPPEVIVQLKVPPLTVKLPKDSDNEHPHVIVKQEPTSNHEGSGCGNGDDMQSPLDQDQMPVYAMQQQTGMETQPQSTVVVSAGETAPPMIAGVAAAATAQTTTSTAGTTATKVRHKCPECPKTFKTPGTLAMHKKVHSGEADQTPKERPYTCSYCGKSFTQSNTLKQHTRIHTGEKPFRCGYCDKAFSVKDYLTKHIRTHTGEKPYLCPYCDKRFTQRSALTVHTTKLHPL